MWLVDTTSIVCSHPALLIAKQKLHDFFSFFTGTFLWTLLKKWSCSLLSYKIWNCVVRESGHRMTTRQNEYTKRICNPSFSFSNWNMKQHTNDKWETNTVQDMLYFLDTVVGKCSGDSFTTAMRPILDKPRQEAGELRPELWHARSAASINNIQKSEVGKCEVSSDFIPILWYSFSQ
jgi:hypothetical protein